MLEMQATRRLLSFMQDMHQCDRSSGRMSLLTHDKALQDLPLGQVIQSADVLVISHIVVLLLRFFAPVFPQANVGPSSVGVFQSFAHRGWVV